MVKRYKVTCPLCRESNEDDDATQAVLDIPHHRQCDGHKENLGMINSVVYDSACWEDRLFKPKSN